MPLTANPNIRKLRGHDSCVNAVAFSSNDGRWLGTGGDGLCTPVLPKLYLLMEPRFTLVRQKTVSMGLVAGRYQETCAHLSRGKCTKYLVAS